MTSRRMSFFEFWRSKKERGDLLERANQLRIGPAQLGLLLGDSGVREVLQNTRIASLLPPVGTEIFSRLTPASQQHDAQEKEQRTRKKNKEGEEKNLPKPASDLEAGKPLPFFYGDPLPELLNTPLEELDPYYKSKKMFIVLAKGNIIHRFDAGSACYLLSPFNPLRTVAIKILIHSLFRLFMMVTILTNCVFMTMKTVWDIPAWSQTMERVFTAVYTFEVIIKVLSRGFCLQRFSFLRDPWNWLDVVVVITGYLTEFLDLGKLSVLGTVPRVLKIFTVLPGVKKTVTALIQSMKGLAHVIVLMVFCLSFLAVIGQVLFMGDLRKKCVIWPPQNQSDYTDYIANSTNHYFLPGQLDALLCGNTSGSGVCPESFMCLRAGKNPNYGFTSYDSFGWSLLSVVRLISQDFWENLVQMMLRAAGQTSVTIFMVIVIPVCFCLLSLVVAVSAMLISERDKAAANHVKQREEEWGHILEVMKRTEEGKQEACRAALSGDADGDDRKSPEGLDKDQSWCPPCWFVCANFLPKWNCCGPWRWLKQHLYAIITSPFFDFSIAILLIVNIIFMSMEHFPMTYQFFYHMIDAHLVFTAIFAAEMVLKLMAMDPKGYFQVGWNIFDSMIVIFSLVELSVVLDIRGFLLMRVFRLARWWPTFHLLIKVMWSSVRAVRNLTLVLLIMVFIFTMAGMQLFQQDYEDCVCRISTDCQLPRWHMNDFFHTFLIIFRVLCGEWIETMWDCMEVSHQATCLIFFMMVMVIGNLLILNLFLTLLLSLFNSESLGAPEEKQGNNCHIAIVRIKMAVWTLLGKKTQDPDHPEAESKDANRKDYLALTSVASNQLMSEVKVGSGNHGDPTNNDLSSHSQGDTIADSRKTSRDEENIKHPEVQQQEQKDDQGPESPEDCCSHKCYHSCPFLDTDTTQGGGRVWSNFRRASLCLVQHRYFDAFIIFIILLSSAALVCEDIHLHHRRVLKMLVERADQVITFLFLVEMVLKWLAFGLRKYFTNGWCWIDFLILQVSLVSLAAGIFGFSELGSVSSLRTLRALGPLRAISRFQGLKLVVHVLIRSLPSLCEVLLVYLMVWLFFSILGVNQFAGKFYYCFNETAEEFFLADVINNKSDCLIFENFTDVYWKNLLLNFDNVPNGYLSLLTMGAAADFYDVMYAVVDARWVESQPVYEHNVYRWLYFVSFIIMSSFFTFNVFIRLFINNLQGQKIWRHIFMTEHQHKFCRAVKIRLMKPQKPVPRPQNCLQAHLFDLVTKPSFKVLSAVVILMYMVSLMVYTDQQSMQMDIILYWISFFLIVIFFTELIVKIVALRRHYFTDGWNIFDFVLITLSVAGLFVADLMEKYFVMPEVFLLLRVVPIFRTLHMSRVIWRLLLVLMMSLPALFNICFLLFIVMFTYSIFGMFNFAYVKKEYMIDDMFNFETFGNSLICLFMSTTSTSWGGLLRPIINMDCDPDMENPGSSIKGNCGNPAIAIVFFTTYIFLSFLLVVCLYITVVMEAFNPDETGMLSEDHLQMFYKIWMKFDPNGSQFIQYSELSDFSDALRDPVRIPELTTINLNHMDPHPHPGDKIHYADVLQALTTQVLGVSEQMNSLKARMEDKFMASQSKVSCEPISLQKKQEDMVAAVIDGEMETESVEGGGGVSALH